MDLVFNCLALFGVELPFNQTTYGVLYENLKAVLSQVSLIPQLCSYPSKDAENLCHTIHLSASPIKGYWKRKLVTCLN